MKTQTNLTMSDIMNFNSEVVNYINENLQYIKEYTKSEDPTELAEACLDHYDRTVDAFNDVESFLSDEQKELFLATAKRLFDQGYVEHAGGLHG